MPTNNNTTLEHYIARNSGANIVFLNGFRMQFKTWNQVYPALTSDNSVVLFNRRGVGESSKATEAQDGHTVIKEMRSLFCSLQLNPPYIFVAHSLGGIFANLYACVYTNEVAGVVFVDSPHPAEVTEQKATNPPFVINSINASLKAIEKIFHKFKYSEDEHIEETIGQIKNAGQFPSIPIAIVSGTKKMPFVPEKAFQIHQQYQYKLLNLSSKSKHYICQESGHFPQITEPTKVISAIWDVLNDTKICEVPPKNGVP